MALFWTLAAPEASEVFPMKMPLAATALLLFCQVALAQTPAATADIPEEKQTTLGLYVTAREAYEQWKADPDAIKLLDVRTPEEYVFVGHSEMAWNVPFKLQTYQWDDSGRKLPMKSNPDFLARVNELFKPTDHLYVMCRSGGRSAMAVNELAKAGFTQVYNIVDGMEGDLVDDESSPDYGKRLKNGWKNAGNPWTYKLDPSKMRLPAQ